MELIFVMSFEYSLWRGADAGVSLYRKKNVTLQSVCKLIMAKDNNIDTIDMGFQKIEIDLTRFDKEPDNENLPILPTRNLVLFSQSDSFIRTRTRQCACSCPLC